MNPEAQRIAIAEACGWVYRHNWFERRYADGKRYGIESIPDYCNSLDAMHEAENTALDEGNHDNYTFTLDNLAAASHGNGGHCTTAAQRAEAFLRTIGKWEDDT